MVKPRFKFRQFGCKEYTFNKESWLPTGQSVRKGLSVKLNLKVTNKHFKNEIERKIEAGSPKHFYSLPNIK